jgi:hypothetical protein
MVVYAPAALNIHAGTAALGCALLLNLNEEELPMYVLHEGVLASCTTM